jgi:hypothetical protein
LPGIKKIAAFRLLLSGIIINSQTGAPIKAKIYL